MTKTDKIAMYNADQAVKQAQRAVDEWVEVFGSEPCRGLQLRKSILDKAQLDRARIMSQIEVRELFSHKARKVR